MHSSSVLAAAGDVLMMSSPMRTVESNLDCLNGRNYETDD